MQFFYRANELIKYVTNCSSCSPEMYILLIFMFLDWSGLFFRWMHVQIEKGK